MTNQLEKKDEDLVIKDKFCETMYELISSEYFERVFGIVLEQVGRNKEYFLGILDKIKNGEELKKEEKDLFLDLLDNELFQEKGNEIVKKLKGFTLEESKKFLEEYPIEEVIEHLKGVVNNEILDIPGFKYGVEIIESKEIGGENYLKLRTKLKDGEIKYCCKKEKDIKNLKEEYFIFDYVTDIKEINGKIYYLAELNNKIYYGPKLNGKWLYVEYGKEQEINIKYDLSKMSELKKDKKGVYFNYGILRRKIYIDKN